VPKSARLPWVSLGGAIDDAILGHCALKAKAQTLYTWNVKDFLRLGAAIADRTKTPST
jgi:hypothetical protein